MLGKRTLLFAVMAVVLFMHSGLSLLRATDSATSMHQSSTEDCSAKREPVTNIIISQDGKYVIAALWRRGIRVWDLQTRKVISTLADPSGNVRFAISPDTHYIASGGWEGTAILWDTLSGRKTYTVSKGKMNPILGITFSPDSKYLLIVHGLSASLLDAKTGLKLHEIRANESDYPHVEFSPDGKRFLVDRGIWDTVIGQPFQKLDRLVNPIVDPTATSLLFSPDGKYIFEEGANPALLADAKSFVPIRKLEGTYFEDNFKFWKFSPNGKYLAATEAQQAALIWDVETGKKLHRFEFPDPEPRVRFFPDGKRILLPERGHPTGKYTPYTIYDLVANKELKKLALAADPINIIITPDNKHIVTHADLGTRESTVQTWDIETGKLVGEYC